MALKSLYLSLVSTFDSKFAFNSSYNFTLIKSALLFTSATMFACQSSAASEVENGLNESDRKENNQLETIVVTATRDEKLKRELPESVTVFNRDEIETVVPSHPSELLNRAAGVHVNNLGGEGHMTSIRQPISTRGVYLFLEDGVPTRPSGFFNHNGLYEVNVPQSSAMEVVKGPGSALYGSDALGGMINALSAPSPESAEVKLNGEFGPFGWNRALISTGNRYQFNTQQHGLRLSFNSTANDGFRDESDYKRQSFNGRVDSRFSNAVLNKDLTVKTLLSHTQVDQSGISSLSKTLFQNDTEFNQFHGKVGFREVEATRISSEFLIESSIGKFSAIPFYRKNETTMAPSWMINYDPNIRTNQFESFGFLTKYAVNTSNFELITGVDLDITPSSYQEFGTNHNSLQLEELDSATVYTGFETLDLVHYDFTAVQSAYSPYLQIEMRPSKHWIVTAGIRYDLFEVDYQDRLPANAEEQHFNPQLNRPVRHFRPESQRIWFSELSPKLGVVYKINELHDGYFNYRHAFTIPSVSVLFRSGSTQNTDNLKPISGDSFELGFRGLVSEKFGYELALYQMNVEDDLVSVVTGFERNIYNAGETQHKGIEISLFGDLTEDWAYRVSWSETDQTYRSFSYSCCFPSQNIDVSGNDIGKAPTSIGNVLVSYKPENLTGFSLEVEYEHLGNYFIDETNTSSYGGHDLINLRLAYTLSDQIEWYGRIQNLTDKLYSTYTSQQVGSANISYRPGMPRSIYSGIRIVF